MGLIEVAVGKGGQREASRSPGGNGPGDEKVEAGPRADTAVVGLDGRVGGRDDGLPRFRCYWDR